MELSELEKETRSGIQKAIIKSQHCQRNWDLSQQIPEEDLKLLEIAATQCPSKQNVAHYKVHFITNREIIEQIHNQTNGFVYKDKKSTSTESLSDYEDVKSVTNSQTLANLLVVLEDYTNLSLWEDIKRNEQTREVGANVNADIKQQQILHFDRNVAVGIAAGYLNLSATLLGYSTGCCSCMNHSEIKKILGLKGNPLLLMGIGFKDPTKNRRIHQLQDDFVFPTKPKQEIPVVRHI